MSIDTTKETSCIVPILDIDSTKQIKNACLYFNKITPVFCTRKYQAKRERFPLSCHFSKDVKEINYTMSELEWLYANDLLDCPASDNDFDHDTMEDFDASEPVWVYRSASEGYAKFWQSNLLYFHPCMLREVKKPIFHNQLYFDSHPAIIDSSVNGKSSQVIEILLKYFPVLSEDTPWEDIIEWRNDKDVQIKLRRLKHWTNKISLQKDINPSHLEDEILYLLDEYEQFMRTKKKKYSYSLFRTIITTTGELLENVLKLKFSKIADMPFSIQERSILLAESELSAPGKELAYIVATKERFSN